jgi:hypothetical protein
VLDHDRQATPPRLIGFSPADFFDFHRPMTPQPPESLFCAFDGKNAKREHKSTVDVASRDFGLPPLLAGFLKSESSGRSNSRLLIRSANFSAKLSRSSCQHPSPSANTGLQAHQDRLQGIRSGRRRFRVFQCDERAFKPRGSPGNRPKAIEGN